MAVEEGEMSKFIGVGLLLFKVGRVLFDEIMEVFFLAGEEEVGKSIEEGVSELIAIEILLIQKLPLLELQTNLTLHSLNLIPGFILTCYNCNSLMLWKVQQLINILCKDSLQLPPHDHLF